MLANRNLTISFHVADWSGKMTWHGEVLTTFDLSGPHTAFICRSENEMTFPLDH